MIEYLKGTKKGGLKAGLQNGRPMACWEVHAYGACKFRILLLSLGHLLRWISWFQSSLFFHLGFLHYLHGACIQDVYHQLATGKKYRSLKAAKTAGYQPEAGIVSVVFLQSLLLNLLCGRRRAKQMFQRRCLSPNLNQWPGHGGRC